MMKRREHDSRRFLGFSLAVQFKKGMQVEIGRPVRVSLRRRTTSMFGLGSVGRTAFAHGFAHHGTRPVAHALFDLAIESRMARLVRESAMLSKTDITDEDVGDRSEQDEIEKSSDRQADVVRERREYGRSDHDADAERGRKPLARVELEMRTGDATDESALTRQELVMQDVLAAARIAMNRYRQLARARRVCCELRMSGAIAVESHIRRYHASKNAHNGMPYESCNEIDTAVPINTRIVEAYRMPVAERVF